MDRLGTEYNGPPTPEFLSKYEEELELTDLLHLEIESFYVFAKILLDKIANFVELYFGPLRGASFRSHDQLVKSWLRMRAEKLNGAGADIELFYLQGLKSRIADFRDKQIEHRTDPRTVRGTVFTTAGKMRGIYLSIFPGQTLSDAQSDDLLDLIEVIDRYICAICRLFIECRAISVLRPQSAEVQKR